jgi:hypothetical protein
MIVLALVKLTKVEILDCQVFIGTHLLVDVFEVPRKLKELFETDYGFGAFGEELIATTHLLIGLEF